MEDKEIDFDLNIEEIEKMTPEELVDFKMDLEKMKEKIDQIIENCNEE